MLAIVPAQAQVTVYSNVTTFTGQAFANGGAASTGGTFTTRMVADDLNLVAGAAGQAITGFRFSVANFNTSSVSARPIVNFYANNGGGGGPGTLLASITFNAISFTAGSVAVCTFNPGTTLFTAPTSGTLWAGIMFDNGGGSTATQSQLNNLGQGIFNPPTVGSSADLFFQSTAAGPSGSNPAGGFRSFGAPRANFGWVVFASQVPEAGSTLLMLIIGAGGLAGVRRALQR